MVWLACSVALRPRACALQESPGRCLLDSVGQPGRCSTRTDLQSVCVLRSGLVCYRPQHTGMLSDELAGDCSFEQVATTFKASSMPTSFNVFGGLVAAPWMSACVAKRVDEISDSEFAPQSRMLLNPNLCTSQSHGHDMKIATICTSERMCAGTTLALEYAYSGRIRHWIETPAAMYCAT